MRFLHIRVCFEAFNTFYIVLVIVVAERLLGAFGNAFLGEGEHVIVLDFVTNMVGSMLSC